MSNSCPTAIKLSSIQIQKRQQKHDYKNTYQLTKEDNKRYDPETSIKMGVSRRAFDVTWCGGRRIMATFKLDCIAHPGFSRWCQVFAFQAVSYFVGGIFISSKGVLSGITFLEYVKVFSFWSSDLACTGFYLRLFLCPVVVHLDLVIFITTKHV